MCLILLAWKILPEEDLIVAANRDEFFARPTMAGHEWSVPRSVVAGRDLQGRGTWLGVSRSGRFAALTNWREPEAPTSKSVRSRGELVVDFLTESHEPIDYLREVLQRGDRYQGFSLLCASADALAVGSNRDGREPVLLEPGIYSLSNASIDTPWPKNERGKIALGRWIDTEEHSDRALFQVLADDTRAEDTLLPSTGLTPLRERELSSVFIRSEGYGTRCSTIVRRNTKGTSLRFLERSFDDEGRETETVSIDVPLH